MGQAWPALAPATQKARAKSGYDGKMLQQTGTLARSILADWGPREAVAGTNTIYAAVHQFGNKKMKIPARPFLGYGDREERLILNSVSKFIAERWR